MTGEVKAGDRLRVETEGYVAGVLTTWSAPFTGGGDKVIPRGTVLVVDGDPVPGRPAFVCMPEDRRGMEKVLVDKAERRHPRYDGYYLVCRHADVGTHLVRLPTG